ncbi:MAG: hypothetical protein P4L26_12235 [Terracidiphilus sp.]|nr:hypothetical protein [Terracidiphilus sp.]
MDGARGEGDEEEQGGRQVDAHQHGAPEQIGHHGIGRDLVAVFQVDAQEVAVLVGVAALRQSARAIVNGFEIGQPAGRALR